MLFQHNCKINQLDKSVKHWLIRLSRIYFAALFVIVAAIKNFLKKIKKIAENYKKKFPLKVTEIKKNAGTNEVKWEFISKY